MYCSSIEPQKQKSLPYSRFRRAGSMAAGWTGLSTSTPDLDQLADDGVDTTVGVVGDLYLWVDGLDTLSMMWAMRGLKKRRQCSGEMSMPCWCPMSSPSQIMSTPISVSRSAAARW